MMKVAIVFWMVVTPSLCDYVFPVVTPTLVIVRIQNEGVDSLPCFHC